MAYQTAAGSDLHSIRITSVKDPADFEIKVLGDAETTAEGRLFQALEDKLNREFGKKKCLPSSFEMKHGDLLAAYRSQQQRWVRAQYLCEEPGKGRRAARCKLLDYGEEEVFLTGWLQPLPQECRAIPFQVRRCGLWGVQPKTLSICPRDLSISSVITDTWDPSATNFLWQCIHEASDVKAEFVGEDSCSGTALVRLYFFSDKGSFCLNDVLVERDYAVYGTPEEDPFSDAVVGREAALSREIVASGEAVLRRETSEEEAEEMSLHPVKLKTVAEAKRQREMSISSMKSSASSSSAASSGLAAQPRLGSAGSPLPHNTPLLQHQPGQDQNSSLPRHHRCSANSSPASSAEKPACHTEVRTAGSPYSSKAAYRPISASSAEKPGCHTAAGNGGSLYLEETTPGPICPSSAEKPVCHAAAKTGGSPNSKETAPRPIMASLDPAVLHELPAEPKKGTPVKSPLTLQEALSILDSMASGGKKSPAVTEEVTGPKEDTSGEDDSSAYLAKLRRKLSQQEVRKPDLDAEKDVASSEDTSPKLKKILAQPNTSQTPLKSSGPDAEKDVAGSEDTSPYTAKPKKLSQQSTSQEPAVTSVLHGIVDVPSGETTVPEKQTDSEAVDPVVAKLRSLLSPKNQPQSGGGVLSPPEKKQDVSPSMSSAPEKPSPVFKLLQALSKNPQPKPSPHSPLMAFEQAVLNLSASNTPTQTSTESSPSTKSELGGNLSSTSGSVVLEGLPRPFSPLASSQPATAKPDCNGQEVQPAKESGPLSQPPGESSEPHGEKAADRDSTAGELKSPQESKTGSLKPLSKLEEFKRRLAQGKRDTQSCASDTAAATRQPDSSRNLSKVEADTQKGSEMEGPKVEQPAGTNFLALLKRSQEACSQPETGSHTESDRQENKETSLTVPPPAVSCQESDPLPKSVGSEGELEEETALNSRVQSFTSKAVLELARSQRKAIGSSSSSKEGSPIPNRDLSTSSKAPLSAVDRLRLLVSQAKSPAGPGSGRGLLSAFLSADKKDEPSGRPGVGLSSTIVPPKPSTPSLQPLMASQESLSSSSSSSSSSMKERSPASTSAGKIGGDSDIKSFKKMTGIAATASETASSDKEILKSPTEVSVIVPTVRKMAGDKANKTEKDLAKEAAKRKALGTKLMKIIKGNKPSPPVEPKERGDCRWLEEKQTYLMHGVRDTEPCYDLELATFDKRLTQALRKRVALASSQDREVVARPIQALCWGAVGRGCSVVGVAAAGYGKTLAYLLPLLDQLCRSSLYLGLPSSPGPRMLILVPSWRKAQEVFDLCQEFAKSMESVMKLRCLVTYAGGSEVPIQVALLNGCDILVATLPCLLRQMEGRYTDLDRLCHLVLDGADFMVEEQTEALRELMARLAFVLREKRGQDGTPRQIVAVTDRWTRGLESFVTAYMSSPRLVFDSLFEAAVYGKVQHVVHTVQHSERNGFLMDLLKSLFPEDKRMAIFTSKEEEARELQRLIESRLEVQPMLAVGSMCLDEMESLHHTWSQLSKKKKLLVLVVTDDVQHYLKLKNVEIVINHDLPTSKTKFGNRMATMQNSYFNITEADKGKKHEFPRSYVLVTEKCVEQARSLRDALCRAGIPIPQGMQDLIEDFNKKENGRNNIPLCGNIKSFGYCLRQHQCKDRHEIFRRVDFAENQGLPMMGDIQVRVTMMAQASSGYVHILKHRAGPGQEWQWLGLSAAVLKQKMEAFKKSEHTAKENPQPGQICAIEWQGEYHRVEIHSFVAIRKEGNYPSKVKVWFCDHGRMMEVPITKLLHLPEEITQIPNQAVELHICKVKPMDNDVEWTQQANVFMQGLLEGKELCGRLVLSVGNAVWVDRLLEWQWDKSGKTYTIPLNARSELLRADNPIACENPQHIVNLYKLLMPYINIPKMLRRKHLYGQKQPLETEVLLDGQAVFISHFVNPALFFVRREDKSAELEKLEKALAETMRLPFKDGELTKGCRCVLEQEYNSEKVWVRGLVTSDPDSEGVVQVFLVDRGPQVTCSLGALYPLPWRPRDLPAQAIQCRLGRVRPRGEEWSKEVTDKFYFMVEGVRLNVEVLGEAEGLEWCDACHVVDLVDVGHAWDIHMATEMVWRRLADSDSQDLLTLLPEPSEESDAEKTVASLCCALHWSEDEEEMQRLAEEILQAVRTSCEQEKSEDKTPLSEEDVQNLVYLVGYVENLDIHQTILEAVALLINADNRLATFAVQSQVTVNIQHGGIQLERPRLLSHMAWLWGQVSRSPPLQKAWGHDLTFILDLLNNLEEDQDVVNVMEGIAAYFRPEDDVVQAFKSLKFVRAARTAFLDRKDHGVRESIARLFHVLSSVRQCVGDLASSSSVGLLVDYLRETRCVQCQVSVLSVLLTVALASPKYRTTILEHQTAVVVQRMLREELPEEVETLCQALQQRLALTLPRQQEISNKPIPSLGRDDSGAWVPHCVWAEDRQRLLLRVMGRGLQPEHFNISPTHVSVDVEVEGRAYKLSLELKEAVLPDKTWKREDSGIVHLDFRKAERKWWRRLLKTKEKRSYIEADLDQYLSSSEEDLEEKDMIPFTVNRVEERLQAPQGWRKYVEDYNKRREEESESEESRSEDSLDDFLNHQEDNENFYSDDENRPKHFG